MTNFYDIIYDEMNAYYRKNPPLHVLDTVKPATKHSFLDSMWEKVSRAKPDGEYSP